MAGWERLASVHRFGLGIPPARLALEVSDPNEAVPVFAVLDQVPLVACPHPERHRKREAPAGIWNDRVQALGESIEQPVARRIGSKLWIVRGWNGSSSSSSWAMTSLIDVSC